MGKWRHFQKARRWCVLKIRSLHTFRVCILLKFEGVCQSSGFGNLHPNATVLAGRTLKRWPDPEGSIFLHGLMQLLWEWIRGKRMSQSLSPVVLPPWDDAARRPWPGAAPQSCTFQPPENVLSAFLFIINCPVSAQNGPCMTGGSKMTGR